MREVSQLSAEQLCGQLLVVGFDGTEAPDHIRDALSRTALGGVILFSRNLRSLEGTWKLCQEINNLVDVNFSPFVGIDQEGGRVQRLKEGVLQVPPMRALGAEDPSLTREVAFVVAQELVSLGFNINFAPVLDVDSNPANPVIGDRAFSSDPRLVTLHGRQVIEAYESCGLMACAKHFPGHGDTDCDSHLELPTVRRSTIELRQTELYPFERLARYCPALMTAHVVFEAFDAVPATLSARLLDLLRREFSFDGVVFSDDLEMGALSQHCDIEEAALRAVRAGCDALLISQDSNAQQRTLDALVSRTNEDAAFRTLCEAAVSRSLTQRRRFPPRPAATYAAASAVIASDLGVQVRKRLKRLHISTGAS